MNITTAALAAVGAALATVAVASPVTAREACSPSAGTCASSVSQDLLSVVQESGSPYAEPLDALDGQTLAQYLARHNDRRLTIR
jgi:hypothetical protein